jgi:pyridoxamine 5'-phosphate oxidase family protein
MDPEIQFTQAEIDYIRSQPLGRIGTASPNGRPDVAAIGYDFDGSYFYISGRRNEATLKYKFTKRNPRASLVIDDLATRSPWRPRGIKIFGTVDFVTRAGYAGEKEYMRITPARKRSWGLE